MEKFYIIHVVKKGNNRSTFSTMSDKVEKRIENIEKSIGDSRLYRGLVLKNGLTALLISDPDTDKSAASLSVAVGSLSEPKDLPGLAHFCEHMLFLGTKKYPIENEFTQFLVQNGGSYNAYTANDHTNYYFSTKTDALEPSLDRFAQFFLDPLFTTSATEREINAVNSEHEKNVADDFWRLAQLEKNAAEPSHAYNQFGTGTKETLWDNPNSRNISVRDELLKFHSKWYSSHLMFLSVLGKENLDTLEALVGNLFGDIQKKDINMPVWTDPIYKDEQLGTKTLVVPVKDIRALSVNFLIPDQTKYYKSMPNRYLSALFGHEGPYSILTVLKKKGWSSKLSAGNKFEARGIELFDIDVDLTEKGVDHVDDIIKLIFQYVNMLKREGPQEWFHQENKEISAMQFQFKDKGSPLDYVYRLSSHMINFNLEDVLTAEYLIREWRPDLIIELLTYFKPENMRVTVVSKVFKDQTSSVDKYYGTPYSICKIPVDSINNWKKNDFLEDFKMPSKNEFIATDFSLVSLDNKEPEYPRIIHDSMIIRSWFKKDTEFRFPKAFVSIDFFSPTVMSDPFYCNVMSLFVRLFNEDFSEYTWDATRASLHLVIKPSSYGFKMQLSGFNHKLDILLKKTIDKLLTFKINLLRFDIIKEEKIRDLKNIAMEQPYHSAMRYNSVILSEAAWTPNELLASLEDVKIENIEEFVEKFLSNMFMESLIYGNIDQNRALEIVQILEKPFANRNGFRKLLPRQMVRSREVQLENGESALFETTSDHHSSSCVYIHLQCGIQSTLNNMIVSLFNEIIKESCFNTLRTQEQLGYIVFSSSSRSHGVLNLRIIVQSDRTPLYVDSRIENYLNTVQDLLEKMPNEEFEKYKDALTVKLLEKPKGLMKQAGVYQIEIDTQDYNFNRSEIEAEALKTIKKDDIIQFYQDQINRMGSKRRKFAVHVKSTLKNNTIQQNNHTGEDTSLFDNNTLIITDITEFKKKHRLYPLSSPFIPVGLSSAKSKL
ncbi:insulin-degrading enzyme isoform X2 [Daktulosphaira vitifoliae]|uniref:insulin-degrading enzyme isoform X2 n=1 Tax=Daktulosphaira vitifoliae TaxID=58002 RepID=UPI0021AAC08A|nr:insulin-degrading enzyme isoform X2 [Daktulosphaira vitifoliae]